MYSKMLWRTRMRLAVLVALALAAAGCELSVDYGASLDIRPKWVSPECQQARVDASSYDLAKRASG